MSTGETGDIVKVAESAAGKAAEKVIEPVKGIIEGLVKSNQQMIRALVILFILFILSIVLLEYFRRWWKEDFELRFPIGGGAIVLHSSPNADDFRRAIFIVPASKCWVNTGLEIKRGERITIRASGQINLAADRIKTDKVVSIPWSEPNGVIYRGLDSINRGHLLILKHYNSDQRLLIGNLIGYLLPIDETDNEKIFPSANNPRPSKYGSVFHIGSDLENKLNDTGKTVNLWLTVNDVVLDSSSREAYLGNRDNFVADAIKQAKNGESISENKLRDVKRGAEETWDSKRKEWPKIKSGKVWDLYYYNNIGHYLVTIVKQ